MKLFAGATISGEGKVRLILDIPTIVEKELEVKTSRGKGSVTLQFGAEEYAELEKATLNKPKIPQLILIDDSISIRKMVGMFLSNAGYKVDVAVDGIDAIEKIAKTPYDLIITDLEMPRMHGYELIAEVRSGERTKHIPIIVLTSRAGDKHYQKAMELGANEYIVKPVNEEMLLQSVSKFLAK